MKLLYLCLFFFVGQESQYSWSPRFMLYVEKRVEFPGIVLESGNYIIKFRDTIGKRIFIQVLDAEQKMLVEVMAMPNHSFYRSENEIFTYHKINSEKVLVVQSWYCPGNLYGFEFVYQKKRAKEIVKETGEYVLAFDGKNFNKSRIVAILPNGTEIQLDP